MPRKSCVQYGSVISKTITPMVWLRWLRSERANRLGRYPSFLATFQMRVRVLGEIRWAAAPSFSTMETVVTENPLSPATSRMVTISLPLCPAPSHAGLLRREHQHTSAESASTQTLPPRLAVHTSCDSARTICAPLRPAEDSVYRFALPSDKSWRYLPA